MWLGGGGGVRGRGEREEEGGVRGRVVLEGGEEGC